jgi:DNA-directed RNA polymerase alpha subunit
MDTINTIKSLNKTLDPKANKLNSCLLEAIDLCKHIRFKDDGYQKVLEGLEIVHLKALSTFPDYIKDNKVLSVKIEEAGKDILSNRIKKAFAENTEYITFSLKQEKRPIIYLGDVVNKTEAEMLRIKNFGRKSLNEFKEFLFKFNLKLDMGIEWDRPS